MGIAIIILAFAISIIAMSAYIIKLRNELRKPRNNVHFYVARVKSTGQLWLYLTNPERYSEIYLPEYYVYILCSGTNFKYFGLNEKDFENLKWEDEPIEVFLNLED